MKIRHIIITLFAMGLLLLTFGNAAAANDPIVRAVFFYSPTCGHCHQIMTETLPPIEDRYGEQLEILEIDTSTDQGAELFKAAVEKYQPNLVGVPMLVVGDRVMVGSVEIPQKFPGLVEQYLANGGVAWPDLPNLPTERKESASATWRDRYMQDPVGSTISVGVLLGLIGALGAVVKPRAWQFRLASRALPWAFLVIALIGTIAATYLSYVETTQTEAVCGPVGDCNAVQQSEYAVIFGFLPMAVFGLLGYIAIIVTFIYGQWIKGPYAEYAPAVTFLLAAFGAVFSAGLTFLEPFVIGATCMWCLTSAVCMGLLLLLSAGPGWAALRPHFYRRYKRRKRRQR
jgi:uncharacterized membrane protein